MTLRKGTLMIINIQVNLWLGISTLSWHCPITGTGVPFAATRDILQEVNFGALVRVLKVFLSIKVTCEPVSNNAKVLRLWIFIEIQGRLSLFESESLENQSVWMTRFHGEGDS